MNRKLDFDLAKYKIYKSKLTNILRVSEKNYYSVQVLEFKGNIRKTWHVIQSILPRSRKSSPIDEMKSNSYFCLIWC